MRRVDRCLSFYWAAFDQRERCGLNRHHRSPCGPASAPAQVHSETSVAAAATTARSTTRHRDHLLVLGLLREAGARGMTDDEIQAASGLPGDTERPRRIELVEDELVEALEGVKRRTRSGKLAQVWVVRAVQQTDFSTTFGELPTVVSRNR